MARQKSIIKLEGTIGEISFYKTQDGYLAREKTSLSADRIANDPTFQRTRENGAEFGRAGATGKILRRAFKELIQQARDNRMVGRLTRELVKVVQADAVNSRGMRNVLDGELELLTGFNFNSYSSLHSVLSMHYQCSIDRATGTFQTDVPVFDPSVSIQAPAGTTHYKLVMGAASIDFETGITGTGQASTGYLAIADAVQTPISLEVSLIPASTHPLFIALGVVFYQQVNAAYYPLKNGAHNALALTAVNGI